MKIFQIIDIILRCSASNYLGRASSAARVKVNLNLQDSPPKITSKPRNATIKAELFVEFTCVATGHPYPDVTWWNNNRIINSGDRFQVSNSGQHLRIEDVKIYDAGTYTCRYGFLFFILEYINYLQSELRLIFLILMVISRAQNRLGSIEVSAILKVKEAPKPLELTMIPHGK